MLADVIGVLRQVAELDELLVVSPVRAALRFADALGANGLLEQGSGQYSAAATQAATTARAAGAAGLLVVPADLPLVTVADLRQVLAQARHGPVVIVPSRRGDGTNALLTCPPGVLPFQYGPDSFQTHLALARRAGLEAAVLDLPNLGLDLDEPDDLRELLARDPSAESDSVRYLAQIGAAERLRRPAG